MNRIEYDSEKPRKKDTVQNSSNSVHGDLDLLSKPNSHPFSVKISDQLSQYSVMIFKFSGNILQSSITHLRSIIHTHSINSQYVIFEMKQVEMISSAGWGFLIAENKKLADEQRLLFLTDFQPDLYQVYESLQLNLIIRAFPTLADCLDFIDSKLKKNTTMKKVQQPPITRPWSSISFSNEYINKPVLSEPAKRICHVIATHGPCSFFKLLSILQTQQFSSYKIGPIKLRTLLKELDLDSFEKRERYYRSC